MATSEKNTRTKPKKRRFYKKKRFWFSFLLFGLLIGGIGLVAAERYTRPYRERADTYDLARINDLEIPSLILDRNGKEIGRVFVQNRSVIPIAQVPQIFIDALRAGEDQRFETHDGVDYIGIVRAVWLNYKAGETTQGASTITQQLARNAYDLEAEKKARGESGMERKLVEAFLAQRIEKRYSKKEILEFYLNRIYFGSGYYGIRSASLGYFGKEPKDLDALESAAIVGCIKNPSNLSPLNNPAANQTSRNLVLGRMVDLGAVRSSEVAKLRVTPLKLNPKPLQRGTTHLYERVADEIRRVMGEDALAAGGFRIHTSIDGDVQRALEASLQRSLEAAEKRPGYANQKRSQYKKSSGVAPEYLQGAGLMIDHQTGEVLAHVGGRSYEEAPYDVIELGRRPLGTAFLPFLYAAGLEQGMGPASIVEDEPMDNRSVMVGGREGILGEWGMETAKPVYEGKITVRRALEASKIAASVRYAGMAGLENVRKTAEKFGLPMKDAELLPRLAVGWEAASLKDAVRGISAFARGGATAPTQLTIVDRIDNSASRTVYQRAILTPTRLQATDDATAFIVHSMMRGAMERGNVAGLAERMVEKPFTGAGKTGTTHDFSDNWFLGYNGRVSCGVWVGFLQPGKSIYEGAFSKDLAMPVWEDAMNTAAASFGGKIISQPESVVQAEICRVSGQRATPYCYDTITDPVTGATLTGPAKIQEFFRKGSENLPFCPLHSGATAAAPSDSSTLIMTAVIDTTPVRSKDPVLLGDDPYYTEQLVVDRSVEHSPRNRTNVLDSFDLGDGEARMKLPWPERLDIESE
ncbi:transglycosylase domain-containing protein [Luteolibacter flavescens]|uniref:Transglycosylase domain-containing protein n=1 Tax=Luteolibacter flavescens TaxID=1859460 RepID=A0ABT3FVA5_9BACT|nr:transglycosylase domain-containing protein [Luteolibacter flavescens]MCW1887347.1 transglycosylase domain-containing protein [Luteolibacter flavescens]